MPKRINLITPYNRQGLGKDIQLIRMILAQAGFQVTVNEVGKPSLDHKLHRLKESVQQFISDQFTHKPFYDINLFIQDVMPLWLPYAQINCLIPNQEWFREGWLTFLPKFDWILCKTKHAQTIFDQFGCQTKLIGFTSFNQFNSSISKDYNRFFHLAGTSPQKGTQAILSLWQNHPEWPKITIIQHRQGTRQLAAPNIEHITHFVPEKTLVDYHNQIGIHLCPSEVEGFGHYLVEAMSSQSVILTTNAPPMNELVTADRGILVDCQAGDKQHLGQRYQVNLQHLEAQIQSLLDMDLATKRHLGEKAQAWYHENDQRFRKKLVEVMHEI